jgi:hypothetical protein
MTKSSLNPDQRRTVEIIEALGFGVIEHLSVRGGLPCYDREPHIVQEIKLSSAHGCELGDRDSDLSLKREFEGLFHHLAGLREGTVDIEVRHGVPFKLMLQRSYMELL